MKKFIHSLIFCSISLARSSTACGGHLVATNEVRHLYSHARYGVHNYDHRTDCDWAIEAPPGKNVHLTFVTFQLESESDCNYDFVEVYSGLDTSGLLYGRFCGNSVRHDEINDVYTKLSVFFLRSHFSRTPPILFR